MRKLNKLIYETWSTCFYDYDDIPWPIQQIFTMHPPNRPTPFHSHELMAMVLTLYGHDRKPSSITTIVIDQVVGPDPQELVALVQT